MTSAMFHIALALAAGPRHGYGLMHDVARLSRGGTQLGPGTLYRSLQRMRMEALIDELPVPHTVQDERRREYQLTDQGRDAIRVEAQRLAILVAVAVERGVIDAGKPPRIGAER